MKSIWSQSCQIPERETLQGDVNTEIAVVGAGLAGVLTAHALQKAGHRALVLEANRIASGQTRNTTAKVTSQHGMIYQKLIKTHGVEKAKQYAMANEAAIHEYRRLIADAGIDCDWEERNAYVYGSDSAQLEAEVEAARSLGLPASLTREMSIPVKAAGAVCFTGQAQFNPLKFIRAIAEELTVYEQTPVLSVRDNTLVTDRGRVQAEHVVFACHYPFINFPGMYFARMHQERSYVIALKNAAQVNGMWIGSGTESWSFRNYGDLLFLGGENHRTGENSVGGCYERLRRKAKEWFPESVEAAHWSAQDCMTADGVPFIGRYAQVQPGWYVATGFQKWGMSSSMVSAMLLKDLICGEQNPYAEVFDPGRFGAETVSGVAAESVQAVKGLGKNLLQIPKETAAAIPAGRGGIVMLNGKKLGVYKDENGTLTPVNITCPHLGCQLEWNPDEQSWDCPCHGSRFDRYGKLISGPAQRSISHE